MFEDFLRLADKSDEGEFVPMFSIVDDEDDSKAEKSSLPKELPILALKNTVLYPGCLLYTSPSPRDKRQSRMPSSA